MDGGALADDLHTVERRRAVDPDGKAARVARGELELTPHGVVVQAEVKRDADSRRGVAAPAVRAAEDAGAREVVGVDAREPHPAPHLPGRPARVIVGAAGEADAEAFGQPGAQASAAGAVADAPGWIGLFGLEAAARLHDLAESEEARVVVAAGPVVVGPHGQAIG